MSATSPSTATTVRAIYRHLLRNVPHALRHERSHYLNIRRLLRDDVTKATSIGSDVASSSAMTLERFEERAANTLLLYLSSMHSSAQALRKTKPYIVSGPRAEKDAVVGAILSGSTARSLPSREALQEQRQAEAAASPPPATTATTHRVMLNLSSLCYFHLSPNTLMSKTRRVGGTDTAIGRRRQARTLSEQGSKNKRKGNRSRGKTSASTTADDDDDKDVDDPLEDVVGAGLASTIPIAALQVPPALARGPLLVRFGSAILSNEKAGRWDGQAAATTLKPLDDRMRDAQAKLDALVAKMYAAKEVMQRSNDGKRETKAYEAALATVKLANGEVKSLRRLQAIEETRRGIRLAAPSVLAPIVHRAEARSGAWMGAARFSQWQRGEWLPP